MHMHMDRPWYDNIRNDSRRNMAEMEQLLQHNGEYLLQTKDSDTCQGQQRAVAFNYPNIRFMRKCAADLLLSERQSARQLFEIYKVAEELKPEVPRSKVFEQPSLGGLHSLTFVESLAIFDQQQLDDHDKEFVVQFGKVCT